MLFSFSEMMTEKKENGWYGWHPEICRVGEEDQTKKIYTKMPNKNS
jgi:hypothetical protein